MLTPAQKHFQRVMAQRAGLDTGEETLFERTAHEQILYRLRLAQSRLNGIQSNAAKADVKKELLPDFAGWIEGTLDSDNGRPDEVITTLMVWAVDCGDLPLALRIGEYVVRHGLSMPDNFGRDAATVLTEEICNPVLILAGTDPDADLSGYTAPLDALWDIVNGRDMPDEVRAKLCKARAFSRRASTDPDAQALSLKLFREAMHLNPNAGVKREIATLTRALKKQTPEESDANAPDETKSAPEKTPARKPAARKPAARKTATGKARSTAKK
ncbi:terminase [Salmonella enterica]|uniref:Terminase n=1 Tax=Salmonella enterica TaxID=28901 RepID=A0A5U1J877_SALER|nr:terminase [Salmonella enterica]EAS0530912.1 terminase [Salmonella enterica]EBM1562493.1 terminase [Salmonella enterica]EBM6572563.1 terminase [Salmonella enterica]EBO6812607.1 terminase [Salmonella enterica]